MIRLWFTLLVWAVTQESFAYRRIDLPLHFEPNLGQADPAVRFVARVPGGALLLAADRAVLSSESGQVTLRPFGANPRAAVEGVDRTAGRSHYLVGDPGRWRTDIPNYARVRYREVYPGIDLIYYGNGRMLEHDWVVRPGADPSRIRVRYEGARALRLDERGDLIVETEAGAVRQRRPVVHQGARRIKGSYRLSGRFEAAFTLGGYDRSRELTIDPVVEFSTFLGGSGDDLLLAMAVDQAGNIYLTGGTGSTNFPLQSPVTTTNRGGDVFVTKIDPTGGGLIFSTYLGGAVQDTARGIAVDSGGNIYLTGDTQSADYPLRNAIQTSVRGREIFVTKLNAAGNSLVYSTVLGGGGADIGFAIALDGAGAAYVAGQTAGDGFATRTPIQAAYGGGSTDAFVAKLAADGSALAYGTFLGGNGGDIAYAIAVDAAGRAHVAGLTGSNAFPVVNPFRPTREGMFDAFVCRLNAAGTALQFSTYLGGELNDQANAIALDAAGNVHVAGMTASENFPTTPGALFGFGGDDPFVTKLNPQGSALIYSTYLPGDGIDGARALAVDGSGNAWVAGYTASDNFPVMGPLQPRRSGRDAFIAQLSDTGAIRFSTFYGAEGDDDAYAIALDSRGRAHVAGTTASTGFPVTAALQQRYGGGARDTFLLRLGLDGAAPLAMVSAASFKGEPLAPESIVAAYGGGLAPGIEVAQSAALPETLAGVTVRVVDSAGSERTAKLFFVSAGQINFVMPAGTADGAATVSVYQGEALVARGTVRIERVAPAIFTANSDGRGVAAAIALRIRGGGQTTSLVFQCAAAGACTGMPIEPESGADQVFLLLFGTGIRNVSAQSAVRATIGGVNVEVLAAVPQGEFAGLDQVNLRLPAALAGRGEVDVVLTVDGRQANVVRVTIGGTATQPPAPSGSHLPLATGMAWNYKVTFPSNVQLPYQPVFEEQGLLCSSLHCGFVSWNAGIIEFQMAVGERFADPAGGDSYRLTATGLANAFFFANTQERLDIRVRNRNGGDQLEVVGMLAFRSYRPLARLLAADLSSTQSVTVPAGTYPDAVRTTVTLNGGSSVGNQNFTTEVWLAPGVGIVRAVMRDEVNRILYTMELTAFGASAIPPPSAGPFTISRLNVNALSSTSFEAFVDYNDPSRSACTERVTWNGTVNNTIPIEARNAIGGGCLANGTAGSLRHTFTFTAGQLPTATDLPIRVTITNARGDRSNEISGTFRLPAPPPPTPRLDTLSPAVERAGQTIASFTATGQDLASVTALEFSPATGITVSGLQAAAASVKAQVAIVGGAKTGVRALTVNSPGGRSNVLPFYVAAATPPAPGRPEIHFLNRRTFRPGETVDLLIFGVNLAGVTSFEFTGGTFNVADIRATDNMLTARMTVASASSPLFYTLALVSPAGKSPTYLFDVNPAPAGTFRISNLRVGTITSTSNSTRIPITFDYDDSTGAATGGLIRVNYSIERVSSHGFTLDQPQSVTGSASRGTMTMVITTSARLVSGQTLIFDVTVNNTREVESNFLAGEFRTP